MSICPALGFAAIDWPFFLSDPGRSASNNTLLQRSLLEPKWTNTNAAPSLVNYSSPIVSGDRVFIGNSAGEVKCYDLSPNATYLAANSGLNKALWNFKASGPVYSTPAFAVVGGVQMVFAGTTDGNLYALQADTTNVLGQSLWRRPVGGAVLSSPVVANLPAGIGSVVFCTANDGSLRALKAATGAPQWPAFETGNFIYASPVYDAARNYIYEVGYDGFLNALDASTGALIWQLNVGPTRATPSLFGGFLFTVNRAGVLRSIDPAPGLTPVQRVLSTLTLSGGASASPAVAAHPTVSGNIRLVILQQTGRVSAIDYLPTGAHAPGGWSNPPAIVSSFNLPSNASIALAGNLVIAGRETGQVFFFDFATGAIVGAPLAYPASVQISPSVGQNTLLVGHSGGNVVAVGMPIASYIWAGPPTISVGVPTTFTLTAVDVNGNIVPSFAGTASAGIQGGTLASTLFNFGQSSVVITSASTGTITLKATSPGGINGTLNVTVQAATPTPTFTPTMSPTLTATPTATPSPTSSVTPEIAPVCASYNTHVVAFYGGNSPDQFHDSSPYGRDLVPVGTVLNPAGGQPEGDRWLGTGFSGTSPSNWLSIPNSAWPGIAQGAMEVKIGYVTPAHVQEQIFLARNGAQFFSVYITGTFIGVDSTAGGFVNVVGNHDMLPGFTYTLRVEWGAFGMRSKINGAQKSSTSLLMDMPATTDMSVGVLAPINDRDLRSRIDALALLNDPDAQVCDDFVNSPSPTSTQTATVVITATPSMSQTPSATATLSYSSTPTVTPSRTRTSTRTISATRTTSATRTVTRTATPSPTPSPTGTETEIPTPTGGAPVFMAVVASGGDMSAGSFVTVDSYDSRIAPYSAATAGDEGDVMALTNISIKGNTVIHGELFPNTASNLYAVAPPAGIVSLGDLIVAANSTLVLPAGDYLYDNIDIRGGATLQVQGKTRLWFRQTLTIQGNAGAESELPVDLSFMGDSGATDVTVLGSPVVYGLVYAPSAAVHMSGHSVLYGAIAAASVELSGNAELHYDIALVNSDYHLLVPTQPSGDLSSAGARIGAKTSNAVAWLPKGKDLAIAPNPSKRDITIGFRLEQEARVRILIADLTGSQVQAIDLGTRSAGEQIAGSSVSNLASGIYIASLEVNEGSGARVRASFKVAVVR